MNRIQELEQEIEKLLKIRTKKDKHNRNAKFINVVKLRARLDELRRRNAEIKKVIEELPFSDIAKFQLLTALGLEEMQT